MAIRSSSPARWSARPTSRNRQRAVDAAAHLGAGSTARYALGIRRRADRGVAQPGIIGGLSAAPAFRMLRLTPSITIPDDELVERFVRASGPGGQNVNKVSTAVELRFDVANSPALPDAMRARLLARSDRRLTADGVLVILAQRFRTQERNREDARERLANALLSALKPPKPRVATKPTKGSQERRMASKRERATIKRNRAARSWDAER